MSWFEHVLLLELPGRWGLFVYNPQRAHNDYQDRLVGQLVCEKSVCFRFECTKIYIPNERLYMQNAGACHSDPFQSCNKIGVANNGARVHDMTAYPIRLSSLNTLQSFASFQFHPFGFLHFLLILEKPPLSLHEQVLLVLPLNLTLVG